MERIFNFSAGPAALPQEVLERARDELVNWRGCGMSVMEMSHRGKEYMSIQAEAEADVPVASLSDVELSPGDSVDIPPGLVHSAWVVGDEGIVFIMGDEEEE